MTGMLAREQVGHSDLAERAGWSASSENSGVCRETVVCFLGEVWEVRSSVLELEDELEVLESLEFSFRSCFCLI